MAKKTTKKKIVQKDAYVTTSTSDTSLSSVPSTSQQNFPSTTISQQSMAWPAAENWHLQGNDAAKKVALEYIVTVSQYLHEQDVARKLELANRMNSIVESLINGISIGTEAAELLQTKIRTGDQSAAVNIANLKQTLQKVANTIWIHNFVALRGAPGLQIRLIDSQMVGRCVRSTEIALRDDGIALAPGVDPNSLWLDNQTSGQGEALPNVAPTEDVPPEEQPLEEESPDDSSLIDEATSEETPEIAEEELAEQEESPIPTEESETEEIDTEEETEIPEEEEDEVEAQSADVNVSDDTEPSPQSSDEEYAEEEIEDLNESPEEDIGDNVGEADIEGSELPTQEIEETTTEEEFPSEDEEIDGLEDEPPLPSDIEEEPVSEETSEDEPIEEETAEATEEEIEDIDEPPVDETDEEEIEADSNVQDFDEEEAEIPDEETEETFYCIMCDRDVTQEDIDECDNPNCPFKAELPEETEEKSLQDKVEKHFIIVDNDDHANCETIHLAVKDFSGLNVCFCRSCNKAIEYAFDQDTWTSEQAKAWMQKKLKKDRIKLKSPEEAIVEKLLEHFKTQEVETKESEEIEIELKDLESMVNAVLNKHTAHIRELRDELHFIIG